MLDLDPPRLMGDHQIENAGTAIATLRALGQGDPQAAVSQAEWPARMQRLKQGPLIEMLPKGTELWLDGGHNAAAGAALAGILNDLARRAPAPLLLIAGMLETKSAIDYLRPLAPHVTLARMVEIPNSTASFSAERLAEEAGRAGLTAKPADTLALALSELLSEVDHPAPRVLISGSLYLAGEVLRTHG